MARSTASRTSVSLSTAEKMAPPPGDLSQRLAAEERLAARAAAQEARIDELFKAAERKHTFFEMWSKFGRNLVEIASFSKLSD